MSASARSDTPAPVAVSVHVQAAARKKRGRADEGVCPFQFISFKVHIMRQLNKHKMLVEDVSLRQACKWITAQTDRFCLCQVCEALTAEPPWSPGKDVLFHADEVAKILEEIRVELKCGVKLENGVARAPI